MTPYRSRREESSAPAPTTGLVADMVRQFADPCAFLRELVQNGIDAGASALDVTVAIEPGDLVATSVADDGSGMTPEVIEGDLLTLFSSSKEGDPTKIGKYGVGFVSVLALDPERVEVETWRGGEAWIVRLGRDHAYTIEEAAPRPRSGTVVTLLSRMDRGGVGAHVERVRAALLRWCRHAERPIRLLTVDREAGGPILEERIDVPLGVFSPFSLVASIDGETFAVGPVAGSELLEGSACDELERGGAFAGFYNRGLTLFETASESFPGLAGVRFKVVSPRLSHTLSRDNVRRDEAFERALDRVRDLVEQRLRGAVAGALGEAAHAAAAGEQAAEYAGLLAAALEPPVALDPEEITFPLTDPIRGSAALSDLRGHTPGREPPLVAEASDAITRALAEVGRPVVRCVHPAVATLVRRCFRRQTVVEAGRAFVVAREIAPLRGSSDEALCTEVARVLEAAGEGVARVSLGAIEGAFPSRTAIAVPEGAAGVAYLGAVREVEAAWRRFGAGHRLLLNVANDAVRDARALAAEDPRTGGHLLARALLVEGRWPLGARANARLLAIAGKEAV